MYAKKTILLVLFLIVFSSLCYSQEKGVVVKPSKRGPLGDVVIEIDGKHFTSLINKVRVLDIGKPAFWPIYSAKGTMVTRAWPMITNVSGEQEDHPHHTGLYMTHGVITAGDVKDLNFWAGRYGGERIRPIEVRKIQSGKDYGLLETVSLWESPETGPILEQIQKNIFRYDKNSRIIDFDVTLKALDKKVTFEDTKEGAIGIRVPREMTEKPTKKEFIDKEIEKAKAKIVGTAEYMNAEGLITEKNVWGKPSKWVALQGSINNEPVCIALMFSPDCHNSPPFWHARGYGLFAANPFSGRAMYSNYKQEPSTTVIEPGNSIRLKYRFLVYTGKLTKEELEKQYSLYLKQSE